jgi:hypothetical protein
MLDLVFTHFIDGFYVFNFRNVQTAFYADNVLPDFNFNVYFRFGCFQPLLLFWIVLSAQQRSAQRRIQLRNQTCAKPRR